MYENYRFYDVEVFTYDSLIVIKNIDNVTLYKRWNKRYPKEDIDNQSYVKRDILFENGFEDLGGFISGKIMAGYNNHHYDDYIIATMINHRPQHEIKKNNDFIINNQVNCIATPERKFAKNLLSIDCFQQIDLSMPSLKLIEGNLGKSILESSVPFDIDRPLTDEERLITETYCEYDVENTIEVFKRRTANYFDIRKQLDGMIAPNFMSKWNTTTLASNILLGDKKLKPWKSIQGLPEDRVEWFKEKQPEVWELWQKWKTGDKQKSITIEECECKITFGFGGLHGVHAYRKSFNNVKLLDVGSMYPSIIINMKALDDATNLYDEIRIERLTIKHTDPVKAGALKLILNSVYGLLKNKYSALYNPFASTSVCVYGQMALYDLAVRLHDKGYTIMNLNTDGVGFVDEKSIGDEAWQEVQKEWELNWNLYLELDKFEKWIQKDVNNYIALEGDKIKVKGSDVNHYHKEGNLFGANNARIIQIAIVDYLLKGISPMKTLMNYRDHPTLYQYLLRVGSTFRGVIDESDNTNYNKVNRIFPAKRTVPDTTKLYKHRADGAKVLFPDTPDRMLVWNDDVSKLTNFKNIIDLGFYANIIDKKLEAWKE